MCYKCTQVCNIMQGVFNEGLEGEGGEGITVSGAREYCYEVRVVVRPGRHCLMCPVYNVVLFFCDFTSSVIFSVSVREAGV